MRNRWRVEYTIQQANEQGSDLFKLLFQVRSETHQNGDAIRLTTAQRDHLVDELTLLDAELRHVYSTTNYFLSSNELYLQGKDINADNIRHTRVAEEKPPAF